MMGYGFNTMMGGYGLIGSLFYIVILADAILLGIWLWNQIQKK